MAHNDELIKALAKVISDPGSVLPRDYQRSGCREQAESVPTWAARAVLVSLPRLPGAKLVTHDAFCEAESQPTCQCAERRLGSVVDTAPEGEVLEADDTVPVEKLAHWLHGEFKVSHRPWAEVSEPVQSAFRRSARALMSQLPELFR